MPGHPLALDGHNVLITLECAGRGLPLVAADDGFIRDVGEISRAFRLSEATDRVLALVADYLADQGAGPVEVFYDAPLSLSGELARRTREIFASRGITVQAAAVPVPERLLAVFPGAIATSDTALIDAHGDPGGPGRGDHPAASGLAAHRSGGTGVRGGGLTAEAPPFPGALPPARQKVVKGGPQGLVKKPFLDYIIPREQPRAVNSAVECHPHTVEVTGSNPVPPTSKFKGLRFLAVTPFFPATIL